MKIFILMSLIAGLGGCATMHESLQLGASMGAITGGAATYAGHSGSGKSASFGDVALGAGIGLGVGLLTSYITHQQVEERRQSLYSEQTEMHFGDLPPSPFIVPKAAPKKGAR